jgi:hypothetical protein
MRYASLTLCLLLAGAHFVFAQAPSQAPPAGPSTPPGTGRGAGPAGAPQGAGRGRQAGPPGGPVKRLPDGKPDLTGHWLGDAGGANYGLEARPAGFLLPPARGIVVDPPDGRLPYQDWARQEFISRGQPERGYDDPTAHCFVAGVPRSLWTPSPYQFIQPPGYLVMMFERMSWRQIPIDSNRKRLPDNVRLWQGDSIGHWEGDTLVVETTNLNGKAWLNEAGDVLTHQAMVVERFTPTDADTIQFRATITDPGAYTRPYTVGFNLRRQPGEILEVACHEDNQDLEHLKHVKEEAIKNGTLKR